jgi:hypothetical protein
MTGVTGVDGSFALLGRIRSAKVIAKAFSAGFQRIAQRVRPFPVGSSERVTRKGHFRAPQGPGLGIVPDERLFGIPMTSF